MGETLIEWKQRARQHLLYLLDLIEQIEERKIDVPEDIRSELFQIGKIVNASEGDISSTQMAKIKLQLVTSKVHKIAQENSIVGKKHKKTQRFAPKGNKHVKVNAQTKESKKEINVTQSVSRYVTPSFRKECVAGANYVRVKDQKSRVMVEFSPEITLTRIAYNKIMVWAKLLSEEIQAMGIVKQDGEDFTILDFFLFRQVVTVGTCEEEDPIALCELMDEVEKAGYDAKDMKCWWHSHNTMGTGPSAQDLETTKKFGANGFLVSLITNHAGDFNAKVNFTEPFPIEVLDIPVYVQDQGITQEFLDARKLEITKMVKKKEMFSTSPVIHNIEPGFGRSFPQHRPYAGYDTGYDYYMNQPFDYRSSNDMFSRNGTPLSKLDAQEEKVNDINPTHEELIQRIQNKKPPYGEIIYEGNVNFKWDEGTCRYKMYDDKGTELGASDLKALGVYDYNEEIEELIEELKSEINHQVDFGC